MQDCWNSSKDPPRSTQPRPAQPPDLRTLTKPPVPGFWYLVPHVRVPISGPGFWVPVLGPQHADPELGVKESHYHLHLAFMSLDTDIGRCLSHLAFHVMQAQQVGPATLLNVECLRLPPSYPTDRPPHDLRHLLRSRCDEVRMEPPWLPGHEQRYAGARYCAERGTCPHAGAQLEQVVPTLVQGRLCRVCPNHGLAFDVETGALVRRFTDGDVERFAARRRQRAQEIR